MNDLKKVTPKKLLWVDLEMTGLDHQTDLIVEVAAILTDWNFNELESYVTAVKQDEAALKKLFGANKWAMQRPENTNELINLSLSGESESATEDKLVALVQKHLGSDEVVLLAGNSIHCDKRFIEQYWPKLNSLLHYRMLDVSAWKVVMQGKYGLEFKKSETHRALDDIRESIAELKFYISKLS